MAQTISPLREARERANLSRARLGARIGIDPQTIFRIEERGALPQLATARALADALSEVLGEALTIDELFPAPAEITA